MSDTIGIFKPGGNCFKITAGAAGAAPTPVQLDTFGGGEIAMKVFNTGAAGIFLCYGSTAAAATAAAAALPGTAPSNGTQVIPVPPGWESFFTVPAGLYWTIISLSATPDVYIVTGMWS